MRLEPIQLFSEAVVVSTVAVIREALLISVLHMDTIFFLQDVTSDSDTENEDIDGFDSDISTESGGDAQSVLSMHSIPSMHSIHSEGGQEDKNSRSTASFPGSCEECQEADGTDSDSKDHGEATQTVQN